MVCDLMDTRAAIKSGRLSPDDSLISLNGTLSLDMLTQILAIVVGRSYFREKIRVNEDVD